MVFLEFKKQDSFHIDKFSLHQAFLKQKEYHFGELLTYKTTHDLRAALMVVVFDETAVWWGAFGIINVGVSSCNSSQVVLVHVLRNWKPFLLLLY